MMAESTSSPITSSTKRIALVGNPNCGKTTLFNALAGLRHKVANYPGVTVERREGRLALHHSSEIILVDLPGAYSLVSRSTDERVMRDTLLNWMAGVKPIDGALIILDAGNLERHLYLATQVIDLGIPAILCLNMIDSAQAAGKKINTTLLSERLGVPVVTTVGNRGIGITELKQSLVQFPDRAGRKTPLTLPTELENSLQDIGQRLLQLRLCSQGQETSWAALLLASYRVEQEVVDGSLIPSTMIAKIDQHVAKLQESGLSEPDHLIVQARYQYVRQLLDPVVTHTPSARASRSDRVDRVLTHPAWGLGIFVATMFIMFLGIFSWVTPIMDGIDGLLSMLGDWMAVHLPAGVLRSLISDGVVAGVGAVVVFLPQICLLFFFIGLLEDTGYMARSAMLMNRYMNAIGLPGKSFIPLLSSFACAIPGIMSTRTIENRRDRFVTILIAPLMSCSARLPVYVTMIGAVFSGSVWLQAGLMLTMYLLGILTALGVAYVLKRTIFRSPVTGFIIELPPYRRPRLRVILRSMWDRSVLFLKDAGSIIFAVSIVLWALAYFPRTPQASSDSDGGAQLRQSYLGQIGHLLEPVIKPLGFDWKIGIGLAGSFAAREVFVSTLGVVYGIESDDELADESLRQKMQSDTWPDGRKIFTPLCGVSLMIFYVLACQCISTLGVVKRETNSWRWPVFMFIYMTVLAYGGSWMAYQTGRWMGWGI